MIEVYSLLLSLLTERWSRRSVKVKKFDIQFFSRKGFEEIAKCLSFRKEQTKKNHDSSNNNNAIARAIRQKRMVAPYTDKAIFSCNTPIMTL